MHTTYSTQLIFRGLLYACMACALWGLPYIIPEFLAGYTAIELALGSYLFYGLFSCLLLIRTKSYPGLIWLKAFFPYSCVATFGYYPCVFLALRYASPTLCAIILGLSPLTIAFYGNWKEKECSPQQLLFPAVLILAGLALLNNSIVFEALTWQQGLGVASALAALIARTWFVVANARYLKHHPTLFPADWTVLTGIVSLAWVALSVCALEMAGNFQWSTFYPEPNAFWLGCAILGTVCSWLAGYLWNAASIDLPVSLTGQVSVLEPAFGLLFVYSLSQSLPQMTEVLGILCYLAAIYFGVKIFEEQQQTGHRTRTDGTFRTNGTNDIKTKTM